MNNIKFSIIIPHKNIPDLLRRCLDSIPIREDVQIIVIDDDSDTSKVDFARFPGLDRQNTEVYFDKSGKGAGHARNIGLEHSIGEWVLFADCDDYYHTDNLNGLFDLSIPVECNMVVWGIEHLYYDGSTWADFVDKDESVRFLEDKAPLLTKFAPWRKMVKRTLISNYALQFEEIPASNDVMFHTRLMCCIDSSAIMWFPKIVYTWQQRKESITHSPSLIKAKSRFEASLRANRYAIQNKIGMIDSTKDYLYALKRISNIHFYIAFYEEWYYLGLAQASEDYRNICLCDKSPFLLLINPLVFLRIIVVWFLRKIRNR